MCLLAVMLVVAGGCGPKVRLLKQDERMTFDALRAGKVAIAGVANLAGHDNDPEYEVENWPAIFESALHEARDQLETVPPVLVVERLGEDVHQRMMGAYRRAGDLDSTTLAELGIALSGQARYAALARIEDVALKHLRAQSDEDPDPEVEKLKITKETRRTARVTFDVYDLTERRSVWSGEISSSSSNQVSFNPDRAERSLLGIVGRAVFGGGDPDYPEAPTVSAAIQAACYDFGRALPKEK